MSTISNEFLSSRNHPEKIVIEGFHSIKHALRFAANIDSIYTSNTKSLLELTKTHSPDIIEKISSKIIEITHQEFDSLSPSTIKTNCICIADKPQYSIDQIDQAKPIIFLENIKNQNNLGAVIRLAAAKGVGAVCYNGELDAFHPNVLRTSRGLQFALPVIKTEIEIISNNRSIITLDENGENIFNTTLPKKAIFVFGSERRGVSETTKKNSDKIIKVPMQKNVSSLNLATTVAIVMYNV